MNWIHPDDIDWETVRIVLTAQLERLFSAPPNAQPRFELVFWVDLNGGLNFDVYQGLPDKKQRRLGDQVKGWTDKLSDLDAALSRVVEAREKEDDFDAITAIDSKLKSIIRKQCIIYSAQNFMYPKECEIRWRIQDEDTKFKDFP